MLLDASALASVRVSRLVPIQLWMYPRFVKCEFSKNFLERS